jgi:hypothetical protein
LDIGLVTAKKSINNQLMVCSSPPCIAPTRKEKKKTTGRYLPVDGGILSNSGGRRATLAPTHQEKLLFKHFLMEGLLSDVNKNYT